MFVGDDTSTSEPTDQATEPAQTSPAAAGEALVATADVPVDSGVIVDAGRPRWL